jgi:hypothetical protein
MTKTHVQYFFYLRFDLVCPFRSSNYLHVWKCSCDYFLKCFSLKNILKLFLKPEYQNDLKTLKNINLK